MIAEDETTITKPAESVLKKTRPVLLSVLCVFSFVYFGVVSLLFLAGLLNSGLITEVTRQYLTAGDNTRVQTLFIFGAGFLLHSLSLAGIYMIWNLRRTGYFLLGFSCLLISVFNLFNPLTAIASTAVYIALVILFGIFYRNLR